MNAREQMLSLMAYVDGELEGENLAAVESRLASDPEAAQLVAEMRGLGGLVRTGFEESDDARRAATFDVADAIMAKVEAEAAPPARTNVRSLDAARTKRGAFPARIVPIAFGLVAAAAALFFVLRKPAEVPLAGHETPPAGDTRVAVADGPGIEVEAVESSGSAVSVFYLPGASELSTSVVVWVDETGEK